MAFLHGSWLIRLASWRAPALAGALLCALPSIGVAGGVDQGPQGVRLERGESPEAFCRTDACLALRWVQVSLDDFKGWIGYDAEEVSRPLSYAALQHEREVSLAVRLLVSEIGADRLLENEHALTEGVGILYTVDNRRVRELWNPLDARIRPFDGCGEGADFASCANRGQYMGMGTWRALNPASRYDEPLLERALDVAVTTWVLQETGAVADPTHGATNYVHRCGGSAYGRSTYHCDGTQARGIADLPGAKAHAGPTLFRAPHEIAPAGYYRLRRVALVDYVAQPRTAWDDTITPFESATAWQDAAGDQAE